jgi:hypothetical protein
MAGTRNDASREPKGRAGDWTEERRRSDEGRSRFKSAPAASGESRAYSRRWYTLAVLCLSLLVIVVDTTIVNVALRLRRLLRRRPGFWRRPGPEPLASPRVLHHLEIGGVVLVCDPADRE